MRQLKIKKVDDKPMELHTKQKAKIHSHTPKNSSIKGANVYTSERGPKVKKVDVSEATNKKYRKSTVHQVKESVLSRFRRKSNESIKVKNTNLRNAGMVGAKTVTDNMEGGEELQQASYLAYEASRPVTGTASKGADLFRRKMAEKAKKKIKKVDAAKKFGKKVAKETAKTTTKETVKSTAKVTTKVAATTATTATGSAIAPGVGTAIGYAAGKAVAEKIEYNDMKRDTRMRKIKFFLDKMKAQDNQTDSLAKLAKDIILRKGVFVAKKIVAAIAPFLLVLVLLVSMVAVPVAGVIGVIYNSPFAIFLPPLEAGDTVTTVAASYVAEFNRTVQTEVNNHTGADEGRVVYVDYEGSDPNPTNLYDILAVYMVKYGVGETATIMNNTSKGWLQGVVNDMCSYTTSTSTETVDVDDGNGGTTQVTKTYLNVNVSLKTWRDMISVYGFNSEEQEMLADFMLPENLAILGYSPGGGGGNMQSALSDAEIATILSGITDPKQRATCDYALHRVGYPYSQDLRDSGSYYDCSSLAFYSWQNGGVNISYGGATSAAAEAQGLYEANKTVSFEQMQPGDLIFYSTSSNGRFKNITHVAIYVGNGKVVEALNESYGVVHQDVRTGHIVMIGRPS